ncbi:hypothetical protein [Xylanibacter brevis]|nr:hypothetical protein [Xylanibacter brevis]
MNKIIALLLLTLGINASSLAQSEMAVQNLKRAMLILTGWQSLWQQH